MSPGNIVPWIKCVEKLFLNVFLKKYTIIRIFTEKQEIRIKGVNLVIECLYKSSLDFMRFYDMYTAKSNKKGNIYLKNKII